jgi:hypothetical protein
MMRMPRPPRREREMRPRHELRPDARQDEGARRRPAMQEASAGEPGGGGPMDYDEKLEALKRKFNVRA